MYHPPPESPSLRLPAAETVSPDEGFITFYVTLSVSDQKGFRHEGTNVEVLKERSRFVRESGKWLYRDGKSETVAVVEKGGDIGVSGKVLDMASAAVSAHAAASTAAGSAAAALLPGPTKSEGLALESAAAAGDAQNQTQLRK